MALMPFIIRMDHDTPAQILASFSTSWIPKLPIKPSIDPVMYPQHITSTDGVIGATIVILAFPATATAKSLPALSIDTETVSPFPLTISGVGAVGQIGAQMQYLLLTVAKSRQAHIIAIVIGNWLLHITSNDGATGLTTRQNLPAQVTLSK